jgi:hypothetical protein
MASYDKAFEFLMENEDRNRECATVPDDGDFAISGINSRAFPEQFSKINETPQEERLPMVYAFYKDVFWNIFIQGLFGEDIASRIFDMSVNAGQQMAIREAQMAVNTLGKEIAVDGHWGPATITAINSCDQESLVEAYREQRRSHYLKIVATNPEKTKYLAGWLARASK